MDTSAISRLAHGAAQGVDFPDQMTFADPAYRRIATHLPDGLYILGQQQGARTAARCGQCGFGAGMTATHHNDIKLRFAVHGHPSSFLTTARWP